MIPNNSNNESEFSIQYLYDWLESVDIAFDEEVSLNIDIVKYQKELDCKKQLKMNTLKLNYGQNHRVDRVLSIYTTKEGEKIPKKDFYPKHYDGSWQNGLGIRPQWPLYQAELIDKAKGKTILWHEGEKAVDYALARGLISTCCAGSLAKDPDYLTAKIEQLGEIVTGIIIIEDNDSAGKEKAEQIFGICYRLGIPAIILPIEWIFPPAQKGDDFVEYSLAKKDFPNELLKALIESAVATESSRLIDYANGIGKRIEVVKAEAKKLEKNLNEDSKGEQSQGVAAAIIPQALERLSDPSLSEAEVEEEKLRICTLNRFSPTAFDKALKARRERNDRNFEIEECLATIDDILNVPNETLDLDYILSPYVANVLRDTSSEVPTNPEAVLTIMLPCLASVIGTRSRIMVNRKTGYYVPFILRTMIVANSGAKKSPTARLATNALVRLNVESYEKYKNEMQYFKESGSKEPKPIFKKYVVQDASIDGLIKAHDENKDGFLCYVDEIYGYFKRLNKFNNGGGDDVQRDLELYEGKPLDKTRASDDSNVFLKKTAISVTGTIQEVALNKVLDGEDDLTGISARWIIWAGKMPLGLLGERKEEDDSESFGDLMLGIVNALRELEINSDLSLDDNAYDLLRIWQNNLVTDSVDALPQVSNKIKKLESEVIKIAGILHYYYLIVDPDKISHPLKINSEMMGRAIVLGNYYLRHFTYVITKCQGKDSINATLMKVLELLQRKKEITATTIKDSIREFRTTPSSQINDLMLSLVEMERAEVVPTRKGLRIKMV